MTEPPAGPELEPGAFPIPQRARTLHVTTGAGWDDRRNTSQTRAPDPGALDRALDACKALRASDPALVKWIEDGHPTLTDAEHVERFGHPYQRGKR